MTIKALTRDLREHLQLHEDVDEDVATAVKAIERIVAKYKKHENTKPAKPPPTAGPGVPWAPGDGRLRLIRDQQVQDGMFSRKVVVGVAIGTRFGPEDSKEKVALTSKIKDEVKKALEPLVKAHGGFLVSSYGSAFSPMGWVAK